MKIPETSSFALKLRARLAEAGLYRPDAPAEVGSPPRWRVGPKPFVLARREAALLERLGPVLLRFYRALNTLYFQSVRGQRPAWVADYLDRGKPEVMIAYGRMNRFKTALPPILRPDLILTEEGATIVELDSVPGGFGLTAALNRFYAEEFPVLGGADGNEAGFAAVVRALTGQADPSVAIVVSEESASYRPEMRWFAGSLSDLGLRTVVLEPDEVVFAEEGLYFDTPAGRERIDLVYRFFELFDLKNIPKSELILYAARKGRVVLTPPPKPHLEEKLVFALFHHAGLKEFWEGALGEDLQFLARLIPRTWVLDPRPVPPHAVIEGLELGGRPVGAWEALRGATQKERRFVIKPSGFSERAWGSRGVVIGHDLPAEEWAHALEAALAAFPQSPHLLQRFHKGRLVESSYLDAGTGEVVSLSGRVRLCPYYFTEGVEVRLGSVMATICPADKKVIHGMEDAVIVPCVEPKASNKIEPKASNKIEPKESNTVAETGR